MYRHLLALSLLLHPCSLTDPCLRVCQTFSSARMGNGHDLCPPSNRSVCDEAGHCSHLFWSITEAGDLGLVFIGGGAPPAEEGEYPLTCAEAAGLDDTTLYESSVHILRHLSPVRRLVDNPRLEGLIPTHPGALVYSTLRAEDISASRVEFVRRILPDSDTYWTPMKIIQKAVIELDDFSDSDLMSALTISIGRRSVCADCGVSVNEGLGTHWTLSFSPPPEITEIFPPMSVRTLLDRALHHRVDCPSCHHSRSRIRYSEIYRFEQVVIFEYNRVLDGGAATESEPSISTTAIVLNDRIQLARTLVHGEMEMVDYQLVGVIHREYSGRFFAEFSSNGLWFTTQNGGSPERMYPNPPVDRESTTATLFFYQRV